MEKKLQSQETEVQKTREEVWRQQKLQEGRGQRKSKLLKPKKMAEKTSFEHITTPIKRKFE